MTMIYERLARALTLLPATGQDIADDLGVTRKAVQVWLRYLRSEGIVAYGTIRGREGRVYVRGTGVTFPRATDPWLAHGVIRFAAAWAALSRRCTTDDLADAVGTTRRAASEIARAMRDHRLIRVAAWEMRHQCVTPVYDRLPCPDVPRPARAPRTEVNARCWAKRRDADRSAPEVRA